MAFVGLVLAACAVGGSADTELADGQRPLGRDGKPDPRLLADLRNAPFPLQNYVAPFDLLP